MTVSIRCLAVMLCFIVAAGVYAQSADNGAWQSLQYGAVYIQVPQDWTASSSLTVMSAQSPQNEVTVTLGTTLLPAGETLESVVTDQQNNPLSAVVSVENSSLPAGETVRLETQGNVEGQPVRYIHYFLTAGNALITLTGMIPEPADKDLSQYPAIFDRIANTLVIDDPRAAGWTRYNDASGRLSLQAPADWLQKPAGNQVLTVIQPETTQVITLNYRNLSQPVILEEAAQMLLDAYQAQNISVAALDPVGIPAGEAYRALLLNIPARTSSAAIQSQQYQYILLRGSTLILINGGCETSQFEQCKTLVEQMVDTVVFDAS